MKYNFDEIIERDHTDSMKYDLRKTLFGRSDVLPFWVADMDFRTPDFVIHKLKERLEHEIFGYPMRPEGFEAAIMGWLNKRHHWKIKKNWITVNPGVVPTLAFCVQTFTHPGDQIIVQTPVYYPFYYVIRNNGCQVLNNPLKLHKGRYEMNLEDLKSKITSRTKMIFICNPHNPGGSVWREDELRQLAGICLENNILMISDEIHSDLILYDNKHVPLASLGKEIAAQTITCLSASKTFNLAGMATSYTVISNPDLNDQLNNKLGDYHLSFGNTLGMEALKAAYLYGEEWLDELLVYLEGNIDMMDNFINENLPELHMIKPEGTYLAWLDFHALGLPGEKLKQLLNEKAGIGLSDGASFGEGGEDHQRWNTACPRSLLEQGLYRLFDTIKELQESEAE